MKRLLILAPLLAVLLAACGSSSPQAGAPPTVDPDTAYAALANDPVYGPAFKVFDSVNIGAKAVGCSSLSDDPVHGLDYMKKSLRASGGSVGEIAQTVVVVRAYCKTKDMALLFPQATPQS